MAVSYNKLRHNLRVPAVVHGDGPDPAAPGRGDPVLLRLRGGDGARLPLLFCPVRMTASRILASFISADFPDYRDRIADRDVVAVFE